MQGLKLIIHPLPTATIDTCAQEAYQLAVFLHEPVTFLFNETPVTIRPDGNIADAIEIWQLKQQQKGKLI